MKRTWNKLVDEYKGGGLYHVFREGFLLVTSRIFAFIFLRDL